MTPLAYSSISICEEAKKYTFESLIEEIAGRPLDQAIKITLARKKDIIPLLQETDKRVCDFEIKVDGSDMAILPIYSLEKEIYEEEKER